MPATHITEENKNKVKKFEFSKELKDYFKNRALNNDTKTEVEREVRATVDEMNFPNLLRFESYLYLHGVPIKQFKRKPEGTDSDSFSHSIVVDKATGSRRSVTKKVDKVTFSETWGHFKAITAQYDFANIEFKVKDINPINEKSLNCLLDVARSVWKSNGYSRELSKVAKGEYWSGEAVIDLTDYKNPRYINPLNFFMSNDYRGDIDKVKYIIIRRYNSEVSDGAGGVSVKVDTNAKKYFNTPLLSDTSNSQTFNPQNIMATLYRAKVSHETLRVVGKEFNISASGGITQPTTYEFVSIPLKCRIILDEKFKILRVEEYTKSYYDVRYYAPSTDGMIERGVSDAEQILPQLKVKNNINRMELDAMGRVMTKYVFVDNEVLSAMNSMREIGNLNVVGVDMKKQSHSSLASKVYEMGSTANFQSPELIKRDINNSILQTIGLNPTVLGQVINTRKSAREIVLASSFATATLAKKNIDLQKFFCVDVMYILMEKIKEGLTNETIMEYTKDEKSTGYYLFMEDTTTEEKDDKKIITVKRGRKKHKFYIENESNTVLDIVLNQDYTIDNETGEVSITEVKPLTDIKDMRPWAEFIEMVRTLSQATTRPVDYVVLKSSLDNIRTSLSLETVKLLAFEREVKASKLKQYLPFVMQIMDSPVVESFVGKIMELEGLDLYDIVSKDEMQSIRDAKAQALAAQNNKGNDSLTNALLPENLARQDPGNSNLNNQESLPGNDIKTNNATGQI